MCISKQLFQIMNVICRFSSSFVVSAGESGIFMVLRYGSWDAVMVVPFWSMSVPLKSVGDSWDVRNVKSVGIFSSPLDNYWGIAENLASVQIAMDAGMIG